MPAPTWIATRLPSSTIPTIRTSTIQSSLSLTATIANPPTLPDPGNLVDPSQKIIALDHFTKNSQELRVASPNEDRLRFVAGLFYERQFHAIEQNYVVNSAWQLLGRSRLAGHDSIWPTRVASTPTTPHLRKSPTKFCLR